jgi:hypothetical protein
MTVFPLKYDGSDSLQDMTDAELERVTYYTQAAYAAVLSANGIGYVFAGSGETDIGSASDTSSTQQTNGTRKLTNSGTTQGYPGYPGTGTETDATYDYRQNRSSPTAVSAAVFNEHGPVYYDSGSDHIIPFTTEAQIADVITNQAITNMRTGDEVGSYRVSTSTPSNGGAGTWTDKGTFFADTTYSAGTTTYKLWVKTALDSIPGSDTFPLNLEGAGTTGQLQQAEITAASGLVQNVLLPSLQRKMSSGLYYTVATSTSGETRGTFTNTRQTGTTNSQSLGVDTIGGVYGTFYRSISSPSGTASTVTTYYLNMIPA